MEANVHAWKKKKNCRVAIIKRVKIGMHDCMRNNDIYYGGLKAMSLPSESVAGVKLIGSILGACWSLEVQTILMSL